MSENTLSQGVVQAIQTYINKFKDLINQEITQAQDVTSIPYPSRFSNMVNLIQGIILQQFSCLLWEDKEYIHEELKNLNTQFVCDPHYIEMNLLLKSKDISHLIEYISYLTFIQYYTFKNKNVGEWFYKYARDWVHCLLSEVEYIRNQLAPLYGIGSENSLSIEDLEKVPYIDVDLYHLALEDFRCSGNYLLPRVRNFLLYLSKYHPHINSCNLEEDQIEQIYSMSDDPLVRVIYRATITDKIF